MSMEDRISDFPDNVLVHILSFLTFKEAVRSALLSRRWRMLNACLTCSNLDFRDVDFFFYGYPFKSSIRKKNRRSLKVVDKIILRRSRGSNLVIENFSLTLSSSIRNIGLSMNSMQSKLDRWINCLAKPGLAVLDLKVCYIPSHGYFSFPLAVLASETTSSLHVLSLVGFHLSSHVSAFSCLRSLSLKTVLSDDGVLEKILKVCPLLENLQLSKCVGLKTLNIRGFLHLKKLEVDQCEGLREIDIDAPTLEVFLFTLEVFMINIASSLPCLRKFEFCYYTRETSYVKFQGLQLPIDMFFHQIFTMCPLLEELKIHTCSISTLQTFHFSLNLYALKTLHLSLNLKRLENTAKFEIKAPNLEKFYINTASLKNIPIISLDASDKLDVTVQFCGNHPHDQLAKFLGSFNPGRAIKFSFYRDKYIFIEKETRNSLASPLHGTKCLEFHTYNLTRKLWEFVDYMLWLSPQATNLKITAGLSGLSEIVIECLYEKNGSGSEAVDDLCPYCKLIPITCWRHCLKEVRIKEFSGDEIDKANVKSFFLEQVENLPSITDSTCFDSDSIQGGLYASYNELFEESESDSDSDSD